MINQQREGPRWSRCAAIFFYLFLGAPIFARTYEVDLSGDRSIKPIFDAGLRPKIVPGIGNTFEVRQQSLALRFLPNQEPIVIDTEYFQVSVGANDQMQGFGLRGKDRMPLDEAVSEAQRILKLIGMRNDVAAGLAAWAQQNEGLGRFLPFGGGSNVGPLFLVIEIRPSFFPDEPAVIGFTGHWVGAHDEPIRKVPITPPPGYESVPMEYPGGQRKGEFTVADGTSLAGADSREGVAAPPIEEPVPDVAAHAEDAGVTEVSGSGRIWILLIAAVVPALVFCIRVRRRRRE